MGGEVGRWERRSGEEGKEEEGEVGRRGGRRRSGEEGREEEKWGGGKVEGGEGKWRGERERERSGDRGSGKQRRDESGGEGEQEEREGEGDKTCHVQSAYSLATTTRWDGCHSFE